MNTGDRDGHTVFAGHAEACPRCMPDKMCPAHAALLPSSQDSSEVIDIDVVQSELGLADADLIPYEQPSSAGDRGAAPTRLNWAHVDAVVKAFTEYGAYDSDQNPLELASVAVAALLPFLLDKPSTAQAERAIGLRRRDAAMTETAITEAVARGWCHPENSNKMMDEKLANAIIKEVLLIDTKPNLGLATTRQLLAELTARIEVDGAHGGGGLDYRTVAHSATAVDGNKT